MDQSGLVAGLEIVPYSPDWWKLRCGNFTGSEAYKLMSEPRGKSPFEKYEDAVNLLRKWEKQYNDLPIDKRTLKSAVTLFGKIEDKKKLVKELYEKKNDLHLSDTCETYILEKVHEKLTGISKTGVDNFATQWGIENEPLAQKWYSRITGFTLEPPYMKFHDTLKGFSVTPDSVIPTQPRLAEFKCPANGANHLKHWLISSDEYMKENHPDKYWQVTAQMNVFRINELDFVSFDPRIDNDKGMFIYSMKYNEQDGQALEERIKSTRQLFDGYYALFSNQANLINA